ncbi:MAG TPA: phosphoribosylanthranilate isomerase [Thermoleophilaceae bacterium]|nr:phosphoribosylanthranilate isomerase [Thermoleophilaceae bacterium]
MRVKICGITRREDAELAVELGAWAIGLIFHDPSPRKADLQTAAAIGAAFKRQVEVTGVFVNRELGEVAELADACSLTMLQLHGDEGPVYCDEIRRRTGLKIMKAARVRDAASLQALSAFRHVDYHLIDAHHPDLFGGTGATFDWELLRGRRSHVPIVLSGGLTPENVAEAIRVTQPLAVDTASGTEASPGVKDPAKLTAFFRAAEQASVAA